MREHTHYTADTWKWICVFPFIVYCTHLCATICWQQRQSGRGERRNGDAKGKRVCMVGVVFVNGSKRTIISFENILMIHHCNVTNCLWFNIINTQTICIQFYLCANAWASVSESVRVCVCVSFLKQFHSIIMPFCFRRQNVLPLLCRWNCLFAADSDIYVEQTQNINREINAGNISYMGCIRITKKKMIQSLSYSLSEERCLPLPLSLSLFVYRITAKWTIVIINFKALLWNTVIFLLNAI